MKFSVELGNSPAPCANEGNGASLGPITFEHIVSNQRIARSVVTNKQTNLCLRETLYKFQLSRKLVSRTGRSLIIRHLDSELDSSLYL